MKEIKHRVIIRVILIAAAVLSVFVFAAVRSNAFMPWQDCPFELIEKDIQKCEVYVEHEQEGIALNKEKTDELLAIFKKMQYKEQKHVPDICFACACKYRIVISFNDLKTANLCLYEHEGEYYSSFFDKDGEHSAIYKVKECNEEDFNFIYKEWQKQIQESQQREEEYEEEFEEYKNYDAKELLLLFIERPEFKDILKDAEVEDITNIIHNLADTALMKTWMVRPVEEKKAAIKWAAENNEEILKDINASETDKPYVYKIIEAFAKMYNVDVE